MSILKTMAVRSVEEATRSIPVIDVSRAYRDEPGALDTVAREVRHASQHVGFFYLAGHGVPQIIVDAAFEASREFHAMPLDEKMRLTLMYRDLVLEFYNANYFHRQGCATEGAR